MALDKDGRPKATFVYFSVGAMASEGTVVKFVAGKETAFLDSENSLKKEETTKVFKEFHLPRFYVFNLLFSICTWILELYFYCKVAYGYSMNGEHEYFALTLAFFVIPALLTTAFSMRW